MRDMGIIINSYDINAFIKPPYPNDKEDCDDFDGDWISRMVIPYQRTALWQVCDYIRQYLSEVEPGSIKRQISFVLKTQNFAEEYPIKLADNIEREYRTYSEIKRDEVLADIDQDARKRLKRDKTREGVSDKQMFIHDLWVDYAKYLRKWVEKIHNYGGGTDFRRLPDGQKISIEDKCLCLAEYIDRKDNGKPHGVLRQAAEDIKGIIKCLEKLDDKYFTVDTFSIPVVDMILPKYKVCFEELFERMEQYQPDDAGIFTTKLLPYEFTHLSSGEYQYAKVLGGIEEYLAISCNGDRKQDKIILLDEPEAYMHPELARQFIARLYEIMEKYHGKSTVQVIIGTHSPFMVSDVLPEEITRLDIDKVSGNAVVMNGSEKEYFGANMHTILADGFFLEYTIGEYSRKLLQDTYEKLVTCLSQGRFMDEDTQKLIESVEVLLPYIGDRLIHRAFEVLLEQITRGICDD